MSNSRTNHHLFFLQTLFAQVEARRKVSGTAVSQSKAFLKGTNEVYTFKAFEVLVMGARQDLTVHCGFSIFLSNISLTEEPDNAGYDWPQWRRAI